MILLCSRWIRCCWLVCFVGGLRLDHSFAWVSRQQQQRHQPSHQWLTVRRRLSLNFDWPNRSKSKSSRLNMSAVGFIGLGIMGEGMAARLLSEGVAGSGPDRPLVVWNRTPSKCEALKERFPDKTIEIKATAREVVEACTVTYSMLSTPAASKEVFESPENGVLAGISAGKKLVDCATLAESDMERMSAAVTAAGGLFLEAPVSGSKMPAATGQLIFLCAGSNDLFDEVKDIGLSAMGKASHFLGPQVGYGTRAKLVVNSLMGTMLTAYAEGLALTQAVGLDTTTMMEIVSQGVCACPLYAMKGPKMIAADHAPNFPLRHMSKDMTLAKDMASAAGVEYSVMNQAETVLREATDDAELHLADEDFSAVFEKVHKESTNEYSKSRVTKKATSD